MAHHLADREGHALPAGSCLALPAPLLHFCYVGSAQQTKSLQTLAMLSTCARLDCGGNPSRRTAKPRSMASAAASDPASCACLQVSLNAS